MREERRLAVIALAVVAGALIVFGLLRWRATREEPRHGWFDLLDGVAGPSEKQIAPIAEWLRQGFFAGDSGRLPDAGDSEPRIVFLTMGDGGGPGEVVFAAGEGLADAAPRALALAAARRAEREWSGLKIDVVTEVGAPQRVGRRQELELERGLHGLAFAGESALAFLPEEVVVRTLVNSDREIRAANIEKHVERIDPQRRDEVARLWSGGTAAVRTFATRAFFADAEGLIPLYRGHRQLRRAGADEMLAAAVGAGDYLRRATGRDGRFVYSYLPKSDEEKDDYNILRHAGTAYSMLELVEESGDGALLEAAERALDYLRGRVVECRAGDAWGACVEEGGYVKLGGNALAILAFAKHAEVTGERSTLELMARLASWIVGVQEPSGEFSVHKLELDTGTVDDHVSEYYPGEALFALARLFRLSGERRWLEAAERGAQWLITVRDGDLADDDLSHDHWLLYALNELHRERPRALHTEHALRLARVISSSQNRRPEFPDWMGSYYRPPRSTPTATRTEALCAAWELARRAGREPQAAELLEAARLGVDFQLQLQFRPESTLYLPDPRRALGGFRRSFTNFEIRIDYVQHNLSSLLALRRILRAEGLDEQGLDP